MAALTQSGCGGAPTAAKASNIAAPSITTQPASQSVTAGQTATFTVVAAGTAPLSYQWQKSGTAIGGATSSSYTTPPTTSSDNGAQFTVVVSNSAGSVTSNAAALTVTATAVAPSITTQPASQSVIVGQTATFTVVATGTAPLSYQWRKSGTAISGATSSSYTTPPTTSSDNGAQFTVVVSNSAGSVTSNAATLTVNNIPRPTATFSANPTTIAQGQSSTLSWTTTNATSVSIDNGVGAVASSGSLTVSPAATTTYTLTATGPGGTTTAAVTVTVGNTTVQHYEYVLPDQNLYVYDMDNNFQLVKQVSIPQVQGIRGVGAVLSTHMLYISYGQFGGNNVSVPGSLLKYDLLTDTVVWMISYPFGVDSFAITPDGSTIYMPDGENSGDGIWYIIDPATGNVTGNIDTGWNGPHDTVTSLDGAYVFMCPHHSPELVEGSTSTNTVVRNIGPLDLNVGPFTINGKHTLAFTTETGLFGFQVSDTTTGAVLYTVAVPGFSIPSGFSLDTPCHGISLSPDEKEIYLIDTANAYVHVFDVSGLPSTAPTLVASIPLTTMFTGSQSPCLYDCEREGWIRHTRDGQYVLVGDSGNVISTSTRLIVATLSQLFNTRMFVEIDWQNGSPISTTTRQGMGYVTQ